MHPGSRRWHQLDHVIIRRRQLRGLKQCRSMHSAEYGNDHALVRCKLQTIGGGTFFKVGAQVHVKKT